MLTPSYYENLCDDLIKLYGDLDNAIISDIVRRLVQNGEMTETAKWQIEQLQESGMLYEDIITEIARRTEATQNHVRTLFEDAGVASIRNDNVRYREAGLAGIIKLSPAAMQVLDAGYRKCSGNLSNLTLTTANTAQQAYITACNNAYMQISSGAFDYNTAIRNAVKAAAQDGTWVLYPSGHRDRIDVAVRRAVLTGVGQTVRQLSLVNANDMDCDLMEITAHLGARPSHAEWQGKLVSFSGKNAGKIINGCRVLSLDEIGYGSGDGFGGWNCRHDWYPFFEGISSRAYSDDDLKKLNEKTTEYNGEKYSDYEITQIQRKFERDIRGLKREAAAYDSGRENAQDEQLRQQFLEDFNKVARKLKEKERQLKDFLDQTGQPRDYPREQNYIKVSYPNNESDSDFSGKIKNALTGKRYINVINNFAESLSDIENKKVAAILEKAFKGAIFKKSSKKNSYFNHNENIVYIAKGATRSTIAHELFHKIDHDNNISSSGLLDECLSSDYENIRKISEKAGLSLEDMLYLKYPEAFEKKGRMKEEYRGFADIIHGMTKGTAKLGYGHFQDGYWEKPLKLQKETFAQYGRFYYENNPNVMKLVNEMLPETSKQMEKIINIVFRFGG